MDDNKNCGTCLKGICKSMCPDAEITMRINENLVHFLEKSVQNGRLQVDQDLMVKEYSRPAAGKREPEPCDLRPSDVLTQTVDYLLGSVTNREDVDWTDIYDFVFDRLRCVRQDMVIQDIGGSTGITILEKIIRFHIYAGYRLCSEPFARFDPKINYQHTQECLKRLIYLYTVVPYNHDNRQEFESVYLLYNLGQSDALMHYYDLSDELRNSQLVKLCYRTSIEYMLGNSVRCLRSLNHHVCKKFPVLLCAIHRHLSSIQMQALLRMNTAYSSKASKFPIEKLVRLLSFSNVNEAVCQFKQCGLKINDDKENVHFLKGAFNCPAKDNHQHHEIIDSRISMDNLSKILLGKEHLPT